MLHITNGESAADVIRRSGFTDFVLPWNDVLHDGPVPLHRTLAELRPHRVGFIVERGWGESAELEKAFRSRDDALMRFLEHDTVVLWFEHDLYDQLQLAQLLDWFGKRQIPPTKLLLVQTDSFLGEMNSEDVAASFAKRQAVNGEQLLSAQRTWNAFTAPDPSALGKQASTHCDGLPFMVKAIRRLLLEYPGDLNGLSLTEERALRILAEKARTLGDLFRRCQQMESDRFLGDSSFAWYLGRLSNIDTPMILVEGERVLATDRLLTGDEWNTSLILTEAGTRVLAGEVSVTELDSQFERSIGGTTITRSNLWFRSDNSVFPTRPGVDPR